MGKKYIIDLNPDCAEGEYLRIPARIAGEEQWLVTKAALTPYTEPDLEQVRKEAYEQGFYIGYSKRLDKSYKDGLKDAWEAARKIANLVSGEQKRLFGCFGIYSVAHEFSAAEAIEKLKTYEQEQEYRVGDEFEIGDGQKFIVLKMEGKEIDRYIDGDGKTYVMKEKYRVMRKTGRSFPEIAAVLQKMRGEKE